MHLFAFLPRVKWDNQCHSHVWICYLWTSIAPCKIKLQCLLLWNFADILRVGREDSKFYGIIKTSKNFPWLCTMYLWCSAKFASIVFRSGNLQPAGVWRWIWSCKWILLHLAFFFYSWWGHSLTWVMLIWILGFRKASIPHQSVTSPDLHIEASCWTVLGISCPSKSS